MAKAEKENIKWNEPDSTFEEGRGLPVTNTSTPIPDVKPPKESGNSGGGSDKKE